MKDAFYSEIQGILENARSNAYRAVNFAMVEAYYIDLVFYNYLLRCFVLIDLKLGKLTHQDLGQMQMYVHYYQRTAEPDGQQPALREGKA